MNPLITIETVPIKIEYVEKEPSSRSSSMQSAQLNISRDDDVMTIQSSPISIPVTDTFEFSSSNYSNSLTYTATAQYSSFGNLRMNVQLQNTDSYQYQQFGRGIDKMVDTLPISGKASHESLQIDFDMRGFFGKASESRAVDTAFTPPDLELKVVERSKVVVKYVGGPIYVPKSADPNYDPSKAIGPRYFPESADPNYKAPDSTASAAPTASPIYFPESADPNFEEDAAQMFEGKAKLDLRA